MRKYLKLWLLSSGLSLQTNFQQQGSAFLFILAKIIRFGFLVAVLFTITEKTSVINGYTRQDLIVFFLFFNLTDILGQFFFRGIYFFRQEIISGEFDFRLLKPISPLFQVLTKRTDYLDLPLFIVVLGWLIRIWLTNGSVETLPQLSVAMISAFLVIAGIHIAIAALGVLTTEIDSLIWMYRDIHAMGRFPLAIYSDTVRWLLTFIVPVMITVTIPAQAFLNTITWKSLLLSSFLAISFYIVCIRFWNYSLQKYSSASS